MKPNCMPRGVSLALFFGLLLGGTLVLTVQESVASGLQGFSRLLFADDVVLKKAGETNLIIHANSDAGTTDTTLKFKTGTAGTTRFTIGVDDSDSDRFKIEAADGLGGGTPALTVQSDGNIALGATSASAILDLYKTAQDSAWAFKASGNGWLAINSNSSLNAWNSLVEAGDKTMIFTNGTIGTGALVIGPWASGNNGMRIQADGNIGVGVTNPTAGLHVENGTTYSASGVSDAALYAKGTHDSPMALVLDGAGSSDNLARIRFLNAGANKWQLNVDDDMHFYSATWNERVTFASGGNVGIGQAAPVEKLDVEGDIRVGDAMIIRNDNNIASASDIEILSNGVISTEDNLYINIDSNNGSTGGKLYIGKDALTSSATNLMVVQEDGNVGIGDASPASTVEIKATSQVVANFDTTGSRAGMLQIDGGAVSVGSGGGILLGAYDDPFASIRAYITDASSNGTGHLLFNTRNATTDATLTERMRILSNGNIGIGVTNPSALLDVNGSAAFGSTVSIASTLDMTDDQIQNVRAIQGIDWDDNTGGTDNKYRLLFRDGSWQFYNGGVVVGNYANDTWTDLADGFLIVEGNVGIGSTDPTEALDIVGNVTATGTVYWGNGNDRTDTKNDAGTIASKSGFFETASPTNYYSGASSWQHLIEARHSNDTNNYAMQIAGSFFDQDLYYRKTNNSGTTAWNQVATKAYVDAAAGGGSWSYAGAVNSTKAGTGTQAGSFQLQDNTEYLLICMYSTTDNTADGSTAFTYFEGFNMLGGLHNMYGHAHTYTSGPDNNFNNSSNDPKTTPLRSFEFYPDAPWYATYYGPDGWTSDDPSPYAIFTLKGVFGSTLSSALKSMVFESSSGSTNFGICYVYRNGLVKLYDYSSSYDVCVLIYSR